ncbi:MAG: carboxypeptidase regulatory-like domain-containing protein, partial [Planctomycetota bacterium]
MRKFAVAGVISLIAVIAAVFFILSDQGPSVPSQPETPEVADDASSPDVPRDKAGPSRKRVAQSNEKKDGEGDEAEEDITNGATLSGVVLDAERTGIAGARVALVRQSDARRAFDRMRSGDRGAFRQMVLERQNAGGTESRRIGAVVAETEADSEGAYVFQVGDLPRGEFRVLAQSEGFASEGKDWSWKPESAVLDFRLGEGLTITGTVVNSKNSPVAGAAVRATPERSSGRGGFFGRGSRGGSSGDAAQVFTDENGEFTLFVASGTYEVNVDAEAYRPDELEEVEAGTQDLVVTLDPAARIAGTVVDQGGQAVAGVRVELSEYRGRGGRGRGRGRGEEEEADSSPIDQSTVVGFRRWMQSPQDAVITDANGKFEFADVKMSSFALIAHTKGYLATRATGRMPESGELESLQIKLEPAAVVSGTVKDAKGRPIVGAFVAIGSAQSEWGGWGRGRGGDRGRGRGGDRGRGRGGDRGRGRGGDEGREDEEEEPAVEPLAVWSMQGVAETDDSGRFEIDSISSGEYAMSVESDRHQPFRNNTLTVEKEANVDVQLEDGATLSGQVVSSRDGKPVADAELRFEFGGNRRVVKADEDGNYTIAGLVSAIADEVRVAAPGFTRTYYNDVEIDEESRDFEVDPAAEISGVVVDSGGNPIARASVSLSPAVDINQDGQSIEDVLGSDEGRRDFFRNTMRSTMRELDRATTDVDGRFSFTEVVGGKSFHLSVEHPDFERGEQNDVSVDSGELVDDVKLVMKQGARIEVVVLGSGKPVAEARVYVELQDAREDDGGEDRGERGRDRGADIQQWVERMTRGDRSANRRRSKETGPDGQASFSGMLPGVYRVRVSESGYQYAYREATVSKEGTVRVNVSLLKELTIEGKVLDPMGEPIEGARITATREQSDPLAIASPDGRGRGRGGFDFGRGGGRSTESSDDRSEDDGSFRLTRLARSTYTIRVEEEGYMDARLEGVPVDRPLTVTLQPLGQISGIVVGLETGAPLASFRLRAQASESAPEAEEGEERGGRGRGGRGRGDFRSRMRGRWRTFESPEGAFKVDNLDPGTYTVEAMADGFTGASVTVEVGPGQAVEN